MHKKPQKRKRLSPDYFTRQAAVRPQPLIARFREASDLPLKLCASFTRSLRSGVRGSVVTGVLAALRIKLQSKWWYLLPPALLLACWPQTARDQHHTSSAAVPWIKSGGERPSEHKYENLIVDVSEESQYVTVVLETPSAWMMGHWAARLLRAPLPACGGNFRLRDGLLALKMTYNPLCREHIAATVDTPRKRLSCVYLADIIEDLEAFDEATYPHGMSASVEDATSEG